MKQRCRLKYIQDSLVFWRNDNESFQFEEGLVKRFFLDFNGYLKLTDTFLKDDLKVKNVFLKVMTREHPWYTIIHVSSLMKSGEERKQFKDKMFKFGYSPVMTFICFTLGRQKSLVALGVKIKRKIIKSGWLHKISCLDSTNTSAFIHASSNTPFTLPASATKE